ncbi:MAG: tRNA-dihydrouridine synthase family protein [Lachnospiraceae bacterium]|nr:tRNA-dihydrouridine synthase family protein [Lachnospiraceae bacterium]
MDYYFAPMEGVTGYIFRNTFHQYYGGIDRFFAPFISPAKEASMTWRERKELVPEHNEGLCVVPQVLTNRADFFIQAVRDLSEMGYREVNLNLGCPSGTVVSKGKGSGFLARPDELEQFFDRVFDCKEIGEMKISVKTRLGKNTPQEFEELLQIYNRYPIAELTIHPRIQKEFYKGRVRMEYFDHALKNSRNPLVYNGDLCTLKDLADIRQHLEEKRGEAQVTALMIGRGLLKNPELVEWERRKEKQEKDREETAYSMDYRRLKAFHDEIYARYKEVMSPDKNVLYRMKEIWSFLAEAFPDSGRELKNLRKSERFAEYEGAVLSVFQTFF